MAHIRTITFWGTVMVDIAKRLTIITAIMAIFATVFVAMINAHDPAQRMRYDLQTSIASTIPAA
jgi:hypothetical protein